MQRFLRLWPALLFPLLAALLCLCHCPAHADDMTLLGVGQQKHVSAGGYSGPGNAVSGWTSWWGLRAYTAAIASAGGNAMQVRAGSGPNSGTTETVTFQSTGGISQSALATFAGTDYSGSCSIAGTTLNCSGGTIGDQVTGTGVTAGTYIVSGSSGAWVVNNSQTVGTETLTLKGALFVATLYDQIGTCNLTNVTANLEPILLLNVLNAGTLPAIVNPSGSSLENTSCSGSTAQPTSWSFVGERTGDFTALSTLIQSAAGSSQQNGFGNAANTAFMYGSNVVTETAADNTLHAVQTVYNSTTGYLNVDGTNYTVAPGANANGSWIVLFGTYGSVGNPCICLFGEAGQTINAALTTGNLSAMNSNQAGWWGVP